MKDPKLVKSDNLRIRVSKQEKEDWMYLVDKYHTTICGLIRMAIDEFIEKHKK